MWESHLVTVYPIIFNMAYWKLPTFLGDLPMKTCPWIMRGRAIFHDVAAWHHGLPSLQDDLRLQGQTIEAFWVVHLAYRPSCEFGCAIRWGVFGDVSGGGFGEKDRCPGKIQKYACRCLEVCFKLAEVFAVHVGFFQWQWIRVGCVESYVLLGFGRWKFLEFLASHRSSTECTLW